MSTAWRSEVEARPGGDVAVVDGVAVVATSQGLAGLDPASGEVLWRWQAPGEARPAVHPTPVAAGSLAVVAVTEIEGVCAVGADGAQAWCTSVDTGAHVYAGDARFPPRVAGGPDSVVSYTADGYARAFATADGALRWEVELRPDPDEELVRAGQVLRVGDLAVVSTRMPAEDGERGVVVALDVADGSVRWRAGIPLSPNAAHAMTVHEDTVFVHNAPSVWALDAGSGEVRWQQPLPDPPVAWHEMTGASPAVVGDLLMVLGRVTLASPREGVVLVGMDTADGTVRWSQDTPPLLGWQGFGWKGGLGAVDGQPVLVGQDVSVLDPATGEPLRTHELGLDAGQPVTAHDSGLLLIDDDGGVRRLDL